MTQIFSDVRVFKDPPLLTRSGSSIIDKVELLA